MAPSQRNVELAKRDDFFSDPFFSDILKESDDIFQKRISLFRDGKGVALATKQDAAHNLQVSASNDQFLIQLELPGFNPEDFSLKTRDDIIILEANHESSGEDGVSTSRNYIKEFKMPEGVLRDQIASAYTEDGVLTISAPRVLTAPEGATISEAMTAASQAYTTDDGTKVAQDSQASSQMITASTQSDDGNSVSSMTFSSSSNSSSTMTSSSTSNNFPGMPSIGMSGGMDEMMKNMMGKMSLGGNEMVGFGDRPSMMSKMGGGVSSMMSSTSMMSSSSFSSSSSSSMQSSSTNMRNQPSLKMQMPSMPKLDIEELSTAGTDVPSSFKGQPQPPYTVTSPPPSREEMEHNVTGTRRNTQHEPVDATILLKLKEGNEYKLVLNMQQFSPEDIVVKLNDRELSISADDGRNEKFVQKHIVPEGIDLDQLTSSFSSDGILVIKAPKFK